MKHARITALLMVFVLALPGCSAAKKTPVSSIVNTNNQTVVETAETTTETTKKPFEFNPHVYSAKLAERIPQDHWDSFNNMCDALRKGEKSFKCSSEEAYKWCTDVGVLCNLFPTAGMKIEGKSEDGSPAFENGTGKISYKIPIEDFLKRQKDFEALVTDMINAAGVESDDTDYEKALKLYVYVAENFVYRQYGDSSDENFVYRTFTTKEGVCINFASVYAYLLLQVNVDALNVGSTGDMDHAWTYTNIDGKWYHIDTTWALHLTYDGDNVVRQEETRLDYFLMSDEERNNDGCQVDGLTVQLLPEFFVSKTNISFAATDNSYNLRYHTVFVSLDEKNKILTYKDENDEVKTFKYGK